MSVVIKPTRDRVVVRRDPAEYMYGSIMIPEAAQTKPHQGTVIAVGPGVMIDGWLFAPDVVVGDKVMFDRRAGIEVVVDGEKLVILAEESIVGVFDV